MGRAQQGTAVERLAQWIRRRDLLEQALTHSSFANEALQRDQRDASDTRAGRALAETHNERLEFLGDAVLQLVVTEALFFRHPEWAEGLLSQGRASIVCAPTLAEAATKLGIGEALQLGKGEERSGGRRKPSLLADAFEAVIGAIYLDGGLEAARTFIFEQLDYAIAEAGSRQTGRDHKTALAEWVRSHGLGEDLQYQVVRSYGPDHDKRFEVEVSLGSRPLARAVGHSKKEAEQTAAKQALDSLMADAPGGAPA